MVSIRFHGAAKEIGRSCYELKTTKSRVLLDAGLKITQEREEADDYPTDVENLKGINAVFLSHAHLDHSGALPFMNSKGLHCPIYCTKMTDQLCRILLLDSLKIEILTNDEAPYKKRNINRVQELMEHVRFGQRFTFREMGISPAAQRWRYRQMDLQSSILATSWMKILIL